MSRRIECPLPQYPDAWIDLPDAWLGEHVQRRDQALEAAQKYGSDYITRFSIAIALLDDWKLPGLEGNPEKWDFLKVELQIIAWVVLEVLNDFGKCFIVPKALSSPPPVEEKTQAAGGSLAKK
jgi:hypothetical protein